MEQATTEQNRKHNERMLSTLPRDPLLYLALATELLLMWVNSVIVPPSALSTDGGGWGWGSMQRLLLNPLLEELPFRGLLLG